VTKRSQRTNFTARDPGPLDPEEAPQDLDDVREILFGAKLQAYERRLDLLEKRSDEVLEDFRAQLSAIERYVQNEVNTLVERLKQEIGPHSALLDEVIQQRHEEATQLITAGLDELRSTSPDGGTVSNLLRKVADRLSGHEKQHPPK
jgi:hypothetical protein